MATIKDVAKLANVSISTVSCSLNDGTGRVSEETKEKVRQAAKQLGYQPNGIARSLKTKKTNLIGVFLGCFDGPVYAEIRRGIQQICRLNNYEAIFAECDYNSNTVVKVLQQKLVDGAIVLATTIEDEVLENIASKNFPIVVMDRDLRNTYISNILIDNENAGYNVAKYFKELQYLDVGYMEGPKIDYDNKKRIEGFNKGVKEFGLNIKNKWKLNGGYTEVGGYQAMQEFIEEGDLPRAMFITNDEMAFGAMAYLKECEIDIPNDIAIVGFDNTDMCDFVTPTLTTVSRPSYELGIIAANSLFDSLNKNKKNKYLILPTELIKRESC
jgi:LacI family transcriptional regulator